MVVGFIGLGVMGGPMAKNLAKAGFSLCVFDRDRTKTSACEAFGAAAADTPRACAQASEVIITCLPGPAEVETVLHGDDGLLAGARRGATWIDTTTNDVDLFKALAQEAETRGVNVLDAPVAGGVYGANHGTLTIFVGGKSNILQAVRPVFEAMGTPVYMGSAGSGLVAKLVTNMLWFIQTVAIGEAMVLGVRSGLEPLQLWDAIKRSAGNSAAVEHDMPSIFAGHYDPSFSLTLSLKDLRLVDELAARLNVPIELGRLVQSIFARTKSQYGGDHGVLHVVKQLEDSTGVSLHVPGAWPAPWER